MKTKQNGSFWVNGKIREPELLSVPLMSSAILRAMAAFDGMIAVKRGESTSIIAGEAHVQRFLYSTKSLGINLSWSKEEILEAACETAAAEMENTGSDYVYVRPMALGADLVDSVDGISLSIACFAQANPSFDIESISALTSVYRRPSGDSMPPSVKSVANYQLTRLAREQANAAGFDDAIIINSDGRVAEGAGSAIIVEREGKLLTPPKWDGCLPSITINILEELCLNAGIPFDRNPLLVAELYSADAAAFAGTLSDLVPIRQIDNFTYKRGSLILKLRDLYIYALHNGDSVLQEWTAS